MKIRFLRFSKEYQVCSSLICHSLVRGHYDKGMERDQWPSPSRVSQGCNQAITHVCMMFSLSRRATRRASNSL